MAYPPSQTLDVRNNGVGLVSSGNVLPIVVGYAEGATADTLYQLTNPNTARDTLVKGPALEPVLSAIAAGGGCLFLATAATTAGTAGSVTDTPASTGTGTVTVAGTPALEYAVTVQTTTTGTVGTGRFRYTLDGVTWSAIRTIPAGGTFAIPGTNLTLTFVPGAGPIYFEVGSTHTFSTTAPHYTTTDLGNAITALKAQIGSRKIRKIHFTGRNADTSDGAAMAAAIATHLSDLEGILHFARGLVDAGNDTPANFVSDFAAFADDRVGVTYDDCRLIARAPFEGYSRYRCPITEIVAERAFEADLSENLGRKSSGALSRVVEIFHNEDTDTAFTAADRVITLRSYLGEGGFYVTNGFLRSSPGSDFAYWDWGCTIDEMCEGIVEAQNKWILSKLRAKTDGTGNILEADAIKVEEAVKKNLKARLTDPINVEGYKGHVSGFAYTVDQTNDFLGTREVISTGNAVPLVPVEGFNTTVGLTRSI